MTEQTVSSMCKAARSMGMSKRRWLQVEDHVSKILRHSGPTFMISYLKDLREYHESRLIGDEPTRLSWHKIDKKGRPSGWQKHLTFRKPKTSIQVIGAMVNSIKFDELQPHQLDKWAKGVRTPGHVDVKSSTSFFARGTPLSRKLNRERIERMKNANAKAELYHRFDRHSTGPKVQRVDVSELKANDMLALDRELATYIADQRLFSPEDITGTSIPMFNSSLRIKRKKNRITGAEEKDLEQVLQAYVASINSAPAFAAQMEIDRIAMISDKFPDIVIKDKESRLELAHKIKQRAQDLTVDSFEDYPDPWITPRLGMNQRAGHIAFLQQEGGKLRAIANPNRYLQHLMRPLQKHISKINNFKGVAVLNQEEGLKWASAQLAEGHTLHSFDLTSATDTLHAKDFLRNSADQMGPITENEVEYFNFASEAYWYSPDLQRDVNWDKGQPLGLGPSFSVLTLMNYTAGVRACKENNIPARDAHRYFRVVGDDFICRDEIASAYYKEITGMGGIANPEKTLVSNTHGEFCSQYITAKGHWPIKPKIRGQFDTVLVDSEKGPYRSVLEVVNTKSSFKKTVEFLAQYSSNDLRSLPSLVSNDQVAFIERLTVATHLSVASRLKGNPDRSRSIAVGPATGLSIQKAFEHQPQFNEELANNLSGSSPVDDILSDPLVRMDVDTSVSTYNHKTDSYEETGVSLIDQAESLRDFIEDVVSKMEITTDKSIAVVTTNDKSDGTSLSTLVDIDKGEVRVEGDKGVLYDLKRISDGNQESKHDIRVPDVEEIIDDGPDF